MKNLDNLTFNVKFAKQNGRGKTTVLAPVKFCPYFLDLLIVEFICIKMKP